MLNAISEEALRQVSYACGILFFLIGGYIFLTGGLQGSALFLPLGLAALGCVLLIAARWLSHAHLKLLYNGLLLAVVALAIAGQFT
ncbi:MAG: hypothetical protein KIT60_12105 [Burkholderiaceae bacterium]|nr:hypothetical protein [Burkholderiaceae bacterium]